MRSMERNWRSTSFKRLDGSIEVVPDDWSLLDEDGRPLARIYRYLYGPQAGRWSWFVLVAPDGTPRNGATGTAATGKEAREAVEKLIPPGTRERAPRRGVEEV
jgi:hypothetical protein